MSTHTEYAVVRDMHTSPSRSEYGYCSDCIQPLIWDTLADAEVVLQRHRSFGIDAHIYQRTVTDWEPRP